MYSIEGDVYRVNEPIQTALGTSEFEKGQIVKVVNEDADLDADGTTASVVGVITEDNFTAANPAVAIVEEKEFLSKSVKVN